MAILLEGNNVSNCPRRGLRPPSLRKRAKVVWSSLVPRWHHHTCIACGERFLAVGMRCQCVSPDRCEFCAHVSQRPRVLPFPRRTATVYSFPSGDAA